ncbi:CLAVATA3/ESR (CLE)-related protein 9 [Ricinus communis]|uniref:CLAVATA3/ESR (CLE)-related protein 9 n=1 Tax=Ricinus communis TaxID=3988 RepID=UPI00201ABA42|nr:CLAVATA3/ESR (CLE)-related protein 9 [Ricinus communis]
MAARLPSPNPTTSTSTAAAATTFLDDHDHHLNSFSRNHGFYNRHHSLINRKLPSPPSCASFPHKTSRSLCIQFQRMNPQRRFIAPPPPSPPGDDQIDPRYGVDKRLVPSGPNPLHN